MNSDSKKMKSLFPKKLEIRRTLKYGLGRPTKNLILSRNLCFKWLQIFDSKFMFWSITHDYIFYSPYFCYSKKWPKQLFEKKFSRGRNFEMSLILTTNKSTSIVVATYIKPQESSNWVSAPFPRKWSTPDWSYLIKRCPLSVKHDFCVFISNIIKHN